MPSAIITGVGDRTVAMGALAEAGVPVAVPGAEAPAAAMAAATGASTGAGAAPRVARRADIGDPLAVRPADGARRVVRREAGVPALDRVAAQVVAPTTILRA